MREVVITKEDYKEAIFKIIEELYPGELKTIPHKYTLQEMIIVAEKKFLEVNKYSKGVYHIMKNKFVFTCQ